MGKLNTNFDARAKSRSLKTSSSVSDQTRYFSVTSHSCYLGNPRSETSMFTGVGSSKRPDPIAILLPRNYLYRPVAYGAGGGSRGTGLLR